MITSEQCQKLEREKAEDLPVGSLIDILSYRLKNTNGIDFVSKSDVQECVGLLQAGNSCASVQLHAFRGMWVRHSAEPSTKRN